MPCWECGSKKTTRRSWSSLSGGLGTLSQDSGLGTSALPSHGPQSVPRKGHAQEAGGGGGSASVWKTEFQRGWPCKEHWVLPAPPPASFYVGGGIHGSQQVCFTMWGQVGIKLRPSSSVASTFIHWAILWPLLTVFPYTYISLRWWKAQGSLGYANVHSVMLFRFFSNVTNILMCSLLLQAHF